MSDKETEQKFSELLDVMARLRSESGCPWDKEQTHLSLKPCLLEETYELLDAFDDGDPKKLKEELGDVLLQVIFHAQIAAEERRFAVKDVIAQLTEKLIRRHPYVFAGEPLPEDTASVLKQRLQIKASERKDGESKSALGNVPKAMPALARAQSITRRAAHLGFDWPDIEPVWGKVEEEIRELKNAAESGDKARTGRRAGRSALFAGQSGALSRRRSRRSAWLKRSTASRAAFITSKPNCSKRTRASINPRLKKWIDLGRSKNTRSSGKTSDMSRSSEPRIVFLDAATYGDISLDASPTSGTAPFIKSPLPAKPSQRLAGHIDRGHQ